MKIYVGMGLTQAPKEYREDFQDALKAGLRALSGVEILDFVDLEGGTNEAVYRYDRDCAESVDLCVFIADHLSIGLGMEIMIRHFVHKPALIFAYKDARVTRMLLGMCEYENIPLHWYTNVDNIISVVKQQTLSV